MKKHLTSPHAFTADVACRAINHVLQSETWALAELAKHANKTIGLSLPLGNLVYEISDTGFFKAIQLDGQPTLSIEISPSALADLASVNGGLRERAYRAVSITGDADLAQLIGRLVGHLRWEYEEDLARLIGDAPANFAVRQGKKFVSASRLAAEDLLENVVEYVSEERKILLNQRDFMAYKAKLIELRESVDRMDKRIQILEQRVK